MAWDDVENCPLGSALGPDWSAALPLHGRSHHQRAVHVEYKVEVDRLLSPDEIEKEGMTPTMFPMTTEAAEAADTEGKFANSILKLML